MLLLPVVKMFNKTLIYVAFFATLSLTSLPLYANDSEVPSEKIQQFVDVYKKIKDQYVDDIDDKGLCHINIVRVDLNPTYFISFHQVLIAW